MSDKYKNLRQALEAGPKKGQWRARGGNAIGASYGTVFCPAFGGGYRRLDYGSGMNMADAAYIAAACPDVVRALLAERDALRDALKWTAGSLQTLCLHATTAREIDKMALNGKEMTVAQILDAADSALGMGEKSQGENHGDQ